MRIVAALMLLGAAVPASADYATYQGELKFEPTSDPVCAALSAGTYHVIFNVHNDRGRIEAYLYGEQLLHGYLRGDEGGQLGLGFVGESGPKHSAALREAQDGSYLGQLQGKTLLATLFDCDFADARFKITRTQDTNDVANFQTATEQFELDTHATEAFWRGMQGAVKEAISAMSQALAYKKRSYDPLHPQLLPYYYFLAELHRQEGSSPASIPLYREGVSICEKNYGPESACAAELLGGLGTALAHDGNFAEAEATLHRSLSLCDRNFGPGSSARGSILNGLAIVLLYTGRYGEAETVLREALDINRRRPNPVNGEVGVTLNNLGALYELTGQYKKSEAALRQSVAIDEKIAGPDSELTIINTLGLATVLRKSGQYKEAEAIARRTVAAAERSLGPERQDHPALGGALGVLASILRETGRYAEAESLYRKELADTKQYLGPDHPDVAGTEADLAGVLHLAGQDEEALSLLKHAKVAADMSGSQMLQWQVASALMQVYASGKFANPVKAIFYGKEAVNDLQKVRGNMSSSSRETQESFVSTAEVSGVYRTLARLMITDGRPGEAQQILAMVKEQEFFEFTQRSSLSDAPKTVATLNSSEKQLDELNSKCISLGKEYGALQEKYRKDGDKFSGADHARLEQLRKARDAAQAEFETHAAEVAKTANDPEAQRRRRMEITDFSRAFQGTLKDMGHDAVVAQYFVLDDEVAIFLVTPDAVASRQSKIARQDLYAQVRALRKALSDPNLDPRPQARALYQVLVAPIAEDLRQAGAKTLMLDLNDVLRYVPFAALYDGKSYLVENISVVSVAEAVRDKLAAAPNPDWSVLGLGVTQAGPDYGALPYAAVELNGIAGQNGILRGQVLLDKAFTEQSFRDGLDHLYPIIHIASHFQFTPGSMSDSFLLLGDGRRLSLADIKIKLNFNRVELLTLSACQTAVGDDDTARGTEVEGLGAIAEQAGAKAVLATLWPVADASTAALMRILYQVHKVDRLDKADALRQAQLSLLHGSANVGDTDIAARGLTRASTSGTAGNFKTDPTAPYAHPFYWAPFILMGNWL